MNKAKQKRINNYILIISLLIIIPSGFTFWNTIQESIFKNKAEQFVAENFEFESTWINKKDIVYADDDSSKIDVYLMGDIISKEQEDRITKKLPKYELDKVQLKIHQFKDKSDEIAGKLTAEVKSGVLEDLYKKKEKLLNDKDATIKYLEDELIKLKSDTIPFNSIKNEMKIQYKDIAKMTYGKTISTDFKKKQDTIPTFFVKWKNDLSQEEVVKQSAAMNLWLKVRLENKKVKVINY